MNDGTILGTLEKVLTQYAEYYQVDRTDCNIKKHISGIVSIVVKDEEVQFFFSEREFVDWVRRQ